MSIFMIVFLTFLLALLILCLGGLVLTSYAEETYMNEANYEKLIAILITVCIFLWSIFIPIGVAINTECHKVWIAGYEAQKETIEASIVSENLSGLERVELVAVAAELNAELATRKARFNLWHHVTFDDTLYDDVDLIQIN